MENRIDRKILIKTIDGLTKLSNGVDPTSDIHFDNDTLLNLWQIKKIFEDAKRYLLILYFNSKDNSKIAKLVPFYVIESDIKKIEPLDDEVIISNFARHIWEKISRPEMKRLRTSVLTSWLVKEGYLQIIDDGTGSISKISTEKGNKIGIRTEKRKNDTGETYPLNLYSSAAQQLILDNLIDMVEGGN